MKPLAMIHVEFLPHLVSSDHGTPGIGPTSEPIEVEICEWNSGFVECQVGWRIQWPIKNKLPHAGDGFQNGYLFWNCYGPMSDSTQEEKIARAEHSAYTFLLDNGWRPKKWERVASEDS